MGLGAGREGSDQLFINVANNQISHGPLLGVG
jgi:hypothetical protein